jgi:hypothetical protein
VAIIGKLCISGIRLQEQFNLSLSNRFLRLRQIPNERIFLDISALELEKHEKWKFAEGGKN